MKKWIAVLAPFLASGAAMSFTADRATLTGKVTDHAGKPLAHATWCTTPE
jgi:protocatechuate 3,4-dioxygenase beta subunit